MTYLFLPGWPPSFHSVGKQEWMKEKPLFLRSTGVHWRSLGINGRSMGLS
uniref:Uncharacterized protein n=1 Tax=Picea glauca TaxID=3330 RepID=A0A101LXU7_PICGL|nr:hypothetical protein ABT39_MTgene5541 [Picea glauca]